MKTLETAEEFREVLDDCLVSWAKESLLGIFDIRIQKGESPQEAFDAAVEAFVSVIQEATNG